MELFTIAFLSICLSLSVCLVLFAQNTTTKYGIQIGYFFYLSYEFTSMYQYEHFLLGE